MKKPDEGMTKEAVAALFKAMASSNNMTMQKRKKKGGKKNK